MSLFSVLQNTFGMALIFFNQDFWQRSGLNKALEAKGVDHR